MSLVPAIHFRPVRPPFPPSYWISLDFLVRIETYQWVTREKARKFFLAFFSALNAADGARGHAEARIIHGASLPPLPIFRNGLSFRMSVAEDMSGLGSARSVR
jgi:hypothetical protein